MSNPHINAALAAELEEYGYAPLPHQVVDSHKLPMDLTSDEWVFNTASSSANHKFGDAGLNVWLQYAVRHYLIQSVQRISPIEACNMARVLQKLLQRTVKWKALLNADTVERHAQLLKESLLDLLEQLQQSLRTYRFARIRAWYLWCTDHIPEMGFDTDFSYQLSIIKVPKNESGQAVRSDDPEEGPLSDAELIMLRHAMLNDTSRERAHIQQRAAVAVALAFGRNPANFVLSRRRDLGEKPVGPNRSPLLTWNIPRIKKQTLPRKRFKLEYVDGELAAILRELLSASPLVEGLDEQEHPLFMRASARADLLNTARHEWAWHMFACDFSKLLSDASDRYGLISPRTGAALRLNTRRLRYTFATNMVRMGVSAKDLAELLDHSGTQHVQVYFDSRHTIVDRLDAAAAKAIAPILKLFKGAISPRDDLKGALEHADNVRLIRIMPELAIKDAELDNLGKCGREEMCSWYPPYSCYGCPRFRPYEDSVEVHERVLDYLIGKRDKLLEKGPSMSRMAVQLDEVIYACAELIAKLEAHIKNRGTEPA